MNEVMASKILATETAADLVDSAIQIVGGEALVESHPLATIFRRVRATRLAEGPTDLFMATFPVVILILMSAEFDSLCPI